VAFFLGIDGGGTKTECVIGDEQRVLGRALGSTIKIKKVGEDAAGQALDAVIAEACRSAGVTARQLSHTCIGVAGASLPEVIEWTYGVLGQIVSGTVAVVGDTNIAHHAAFHGGPGVLVIAGTGSNVLGIDERGETARAGGWGPIISDEGSGFWIGRTAVAQAMRAHDAGRPTELLSAIMKAWNLATRDNVVSMANCNPPPDFASLLPEVLRCAQAGDALAREVLAEAAKQLAQLASMVVRKLWPQPVKVAVAITGGVFAHSQEIGKMFAATLRTEWPAISVNLETVHPVMGALSIARENR
jgi:N-acetylglucosamine kinase-like BadF-type ATPase